MTSFLISLSVHLTLVLMSLFLWFIGQGERSVDLDGQFVATNDFDDTSIQISLPDNDANPLDQVLESMELVNVEVMDHQPQLVDLISFQPADWMVDDLADSNNSAEIIWNAARFSDSTQSSTKESMRGASFFGILPEGDRIVYLIDMSPSMQVGKYQTRFKRAVDEVLRSVDSLEESQQFMVIMFSFTTHRIQIDSNKDFAAATQKNKDVLEKKIRSIRLSNGTDPREAIVAALKLKPTCIFLLSDGEFNGRFYRNGTYRDRTSAFELAARHNKNNCPIHTIGLEEPLTQAQLSQIAEGSGGTHVFVPAED